MPEPLREQQIRAVGVNGLIRQAEVDDALIPNGAVTEVVNFHFDRKGAASVRLGITGLGGTISTGATSTQGYPIWGLHNVANGSILAVVSTGGSSRVFAYGSSWVSNLTSGTANTTKRFLNFAGKVIAINWGTASNQYSSMQFWTGRENNASWTATGNPINPQNLNSNNIFPQYGEVYKSRVYVSGDPNYPSRLWFSSVISSAGNITWSPTSDYVDINPGDGEDNTGLKRFGLELEFFKPNYIYRFRTSGTDPDPLVKIGTRSNESIIEGKKGLYFHHDTGFYRYTGSEVPTEISRPIIDVVKAIPFSQYSSIAAWKDQDHIYWSIGTISIGDVATEIPPGTPSWKNVVVRFTESSEVWTVYFLSNNPKLGMSYNSGSALSTVLGLDNGVVATLDSGTTDLGEPINHRLITKWYEWEGIATRKTINQMIAICDKAQDTQMFYQIDDRPEWFPFFPGFQLRKLVSYWKGETKPFHRIRFKIAGSTRVEGAIFQGLQVLSGNQEGLVF